MHKDMNIHIDTLSKIEGHANLDIKIRNNKVKYVKLSVLENKRFFTQAVRGMPVTAVPMLVSRICGTCSIAHLTCATEAIEKALDITPSKQTVLLRKLALYGTFIRDHAMHLYLFCLPDLFGYDSLLDFAGKYKHLISECFEVKAAGTALANWAAGRAIHPAYSRIGSWAVLPKPESARIVAKKLLACRSHVLELAKIFYNCDWCFERDSNFVALVTPDFSFLEGSIHDTKGLCIEEKDYYQYLHNIIRPYSQSEAFEFEGKEYMVGALARINLNADALHRFTQRDCITLLKKFPSTNVFANNVAQAIETIHCIDHSTELLSDIEIKSEKLPHIKFKKSKGAGAIEAPRGTLWYSFQINTSGKVRSVNIIIPTAQNQIKMENDIRLLVTKLIGQRKTVIVRECEKLIRAYDPCMSCASHFLHVRWL